jgi:sec-independent protein translocase protein TatC
VSSDKNLTILGHLAEIRRRLIRGVIAVLITTVISFIFYERILNILIAPAPVNIQLQAIEMTEMLSISMRIAIVCGIILASPYLTYELIMFVSPALTRKEKRYVYLVLPWIALMFAAGVAFGYFVLIPRMTYFLLTWGSNIVDVVPKIGSYINLVTRLLLAVGLVFEMPVLTTFLARIGVLKPKWLADRRKGAIIFAFILAAIITPTIDPINQCLVAIPLVLLYELSIWLAKLVQPRTAPEVTPASSPTS